MAHLRAIQDQNVLDFNDDYFIMKFTDILNLNKMTSSTTPKQL